MDILTPFRRKPPKGFGIHIPSKPWGLSPADSRSLSPVRFWKVFPRRARTSLPSFIQSYSSQRLITGLSSANNHKRSHSPEFFLSPAEFIKSFPAQLINMIPRGVYLCYHQPESPPELNFPQSANFQYPQRSQTNEPSPRRALGREILSSPVRSPELLPIKLKILSLTSPAWVY